jgi:hypothetical protein
MRTLTLVLVPLVLLSVTAGCDEALLPDQVKAFVAARQNNGDVFGTQSQLHLQLRDGSCDGDGNQYGGADGQNGDGGNGGGDRDRLRDGTCGD